MEYRLHRGYILGPGYASPAYGIQEVDIFKSKEDVNSGIKFHTADQEWEAESLLLGLEIGPALQADVDELNALATIKHENRRELQDVIANAVRDYDTNVDQYNRGLLTPRDFTSQMVLTWATAQDEISRLG